MAHVIGVNPFDVSVVGLSVGKLGSVIPSAENVNSFVALPLVEHKGKADKVHAAGGINAADYTIVNVTVDSSGSRYV